MFGPIVWLLAWATAGAGVAGTRYVRDDQFDMAEALTSVAIALLGITALTHRRRLLYVGWTFAGLGLLMGIAGFAHLNLHPAFLAHLLGG